MKSFTFDTNCIIDVAEARTSACFVLDIVRAHREQRACAAFVAVSASERQPGDTYLETYSDFIARLNSLELEDIPQIMGMGCWGLSYYDNAIYADDEGQAREREIHNILFPSIDFSLSDFARAKGIENLDVLSKDARNWRNAWCDRQMIWAHDHHSRYVFVTRDRNFRKLNGLKRFENLTVCSPEQAAALLD